MPAGPWNDATDRKLLLSIIHITAPQLPKWDQIAGMMGDGFTAESVRQHFQKLRKDTKAEFGDADGGTKNATPRKPKAAGSETPKSTGKRKAKATAELDDDEVNKTPSKKQAVKEEDGDDELV